MSQRILLVLQLVVAVAMVALSVVWPQGQGSPSPAPFGHPMAAPERTITVGGQPITNIRGLQPAPEATPARPAR